MNPTYRTWLQDRYYNSDDPVVREQAAALLQVVGDDGRLNANFVQNPYTFTGRADGQVRGYGPAGMTKINQAMLDAFNSPNRQFSGAGNVLGTSDTVVGGTGYDVAATRALKDEIKGKRSAIDEAYNALFGDLDSLSRNRVAEIDKKQGENTSNLTTQYTESLPVLDQSYSAVGAYDSTNRGDARDKAKSGYEKSVKEVGDAANEERTKVGQYVSENKAKFGADRDSVMRLIDRVDQTNDAGDLRQARNDVENKQGELGVQRASLVSDAGAKGELAKIGAGNDRFEAIKSSLDQIVNSSMAGGVKAAAVQAVANSADLTDEEKNKIKLQYGNVYDAPSVA